MGREWNSFPVSVCPWIRSPKCKCSSAERTNIGENARREHLFMGITLLLHRSFQSVLYRARCPIFIIPLISRNARNCPFFSALTLLLNELLVPVLLEIVNISWLPPVSHLHFCSNKCRRCFSLNCFYYFSISRCQNNYFHMNKEISIDLNEGLASSGWHHLEDFLPWKN